MQTPQYHRIEIPLCYPQLPYTKEHATGWSLICMFPRHPLSPKACHLQNPYSIGIVTTFSSFPGRGAGDRDGAGKIFTLTPAILPHMQGIPKPCAQAPHSDSPASYSTRM